MDEDIGHPARTRSFTAEPIRATTLAIGATCQRTHTPFRDGWTTRRGMRAGQGAQGQPRSCSQILAAV